MTGRSIVILLLLIGLAAAPVGSAVIYALSFIFFSSPAQTSWSDFETTVGFASVFAVLVTVPATFIIGFPIAIKFADAKWMRWYLAFAIGTAAATFIVFPLTWQFPSALLIGISYGGIIGFALWLLIARQTQESRDA